MFKDSILEIMQDRQLSRQQMSELLGMDYQVIGRWIRGEVEADFETLVKIADRLNVSVDYLLGRTDQMYFQCENKTVRIDKQTMEIIQLIHKLNQDNLKTLLSNAKFLFSEQEK